MLNESFLFHHSLILVVHPHKCFLVYCISGILRYVLAIHADFLRVTDTTQLNVEIAVLFINEEESPGLKTGGVLNVVRRSVEVICRAGSIPDSIIIDLTGREVGDSIHISEVNLPEGATPAITDRDFTIATIAAPTVMAAVEELEEMVEGEEGEEDADETSSDADGEDGSDSEDS